MRGRNSSHGSNPPAHSPGQSPTDLVGSPCRIPRIPHGCSLAHGRLGLSSTHSRAFWRARHPTLCSRQPVSLRDPGGCPGQAACPYPREGRVVARRRWDSSFPGLQPSKNGTACGNHVRCVEARLTHTNAVGFHVWGIHPGHAVESQELAFEAHTEYTSKSG